MKILLVIDLQKELKDKAGNYERCLEYINSSKYDKVIATVFQNSRKVNGSFFRKLKRKECSDADENSIEFKADQIVIKRSYGLPQDFFSKKDEIDVIGCEADASVLATCFGLWDDDMNFKVLTDYIYTNTDCNLPELLKIFRKNFGTCVKE